MDNNFLMVSFLEEVLDLLQKWENEVLSWERDQKSHGDYVELFRVAHNIKGSAKMLGLEDLGQFVHHLEDIITLLTNQGTPTSKELINLFLQSHSFMLDWLNKLAENNLYVPSDLGEVMNEIVRFRVLLSESKKSEDLSNEKSDAIVLSLPKGSFDHFNEDLVHNVEEDLTIYKMDKIIKEIPYATFQENSLTFTVRILGEKIDLAGIQFLLLLKKEFNPKISIVIESNDIKERINLIGLKGVI